MYVKKGLSMSVMIPIFWGWNLMSRALRSLMKGGPACKQSLRLDWVRDWWQLWLYTILNSVVAESFFTGWWGIKWHTAGVLDTTTCLMKPSFSCSAMMSPYRFSRTGVCLSLQTKDCLQMLWFDGKGGWFSFHGIFTMHYSSGLHLMEDSRYELRKRSIGGDSWHDNVPTDSTSQNLGTAVQSSTGWATAWNTLRSLVLLSDGGMGPESK